MLDPAGHCGLEKASFSIDDPFSETPFGPLFGSVSYVVNGYRGLCVMKARYILCWGGLSHSERSLLRF